MCINTWRVSAPGVCFAPLYVIIFIIDQSADYFHWCIKSAATIISGNVRITVNTIKKICLVAPWVQTEPPAGVKFLQIQVFLCISYLAVSACKQGAAPDDNQLQLKSMFVSPFEINHI